MKTNPQLTVSDLFTGILPVTEHATSLTRGRISWLNFGEVGLPGPKLLMPFHLSTSTIQLLQTIDWYKRLHNGGKSTPTKQAKSEFIKTLQCFNIRQYNTSPNGVWYVLA